MRHPNRSWRVDETYVRVAGQWTYLYRAIDSAGNTIGFLLSPKRDLIAAESFLHLALWQAGQFHRRVINVEGHPAYRSAIEQLERSGELGQRCQYRRPPYLNNMPRCMNRSATPRRPTASLIVSFTMLIASRWRFIDVSESRKDESRTRQRPISSWSTSF